MDEVASVIGPGNNAMGNCSITKIKIQVHFINYLIAMNILFTGIKLNWYNTWLLMSILVNQIKFNWYNARLLMGIFDH